MVRDSLERLRDEIVGLRREVDGVSKEVSEVSKDVTQRFDLLRRQDIEAMKIDIATLKVRMLMWTAAIGALTSAVMSALVAKLMH